MIPPEQRGAFRRFRLPPGGEQRWGLAATLAALALFLWVYWTDEAAHHPGSDGLYTWLFARSALFDHDLDFANDYAICGDPFGLGVNHGTGHADNPYYLGPALFWTPLLWVARNVIPISSGAPAAVALGCRGPLTAFTLQVAAFVGAATLFVCYRVARRFADDGPAALSAALFVLCGSIAAYATVMPGHAHAYATFAVALLSLASLRAAEAPEARGRWALVGLALGFAALQRPPILVWGLVPAALAWRTLRGRRSALAVAAAFLAAGAFGGAFPQLWVYKYMYGSWFWQTAGRHYLHLGHAHPFLLLFAPHGGLFYNTPVAWLAVLGLRQAWRTPEARWLVVPALAVAVFEIYLYSAGLDWDGSGTFGARRLTTLTPLFVVLGALALARAHRWLVARPSRGMTALGLAVAIPLAFTTLGAITALPRGLLPIDRGASQADLYGGGAKVAWSVLDEEIGDPAILPAELVFKLRYGLPMNRFREATEASWYVRDFKRMRFLARDLPLGDARLARTASGLVPRVGGLQMAAPRARLVFTAQWPFATSLTVRASAARGTSIAVGSGRAFGRVVWFGAVAVPGGGGEVAASVPIPAGGFDSGINELVFDCPDAAGAEVVLRNVRIEDATAHPPAFDR